MTRLHANRHKALITVTARGLDEFDRSHGVRSRVLAILRLATRVLGMKRRSIGRLGSSGAAIAVLLMGMGLGVSDAQAQYAAGGSAAPAANATNEQILNRATGVGNLNFPTNGTANSTPQGVAIGTTDTVLGGGVAVGFDNSVGAAGAAGFAFGNENLAQGAYSSALGYANTASGTASTAIGVINTASGNTAIAMGRQSTASGNFSIAQGNVATASAINAIALGNSTQATAVGAIVIGSGTTTASNNFDATSSLATGVNSIAIGVTSKATAADTTAVGELATVSGQFGSAYGFKATASGVGATAIGGNTTAGATAAAADAIAVGGQSSVTVAATSGIAIGKGAVASIAANAEAIGVNSAASAANATAVGAFTVASAANTTVLGGGATAATAAHASAAGATAIGSNATAGAAASGADAISVGGQSSVAAAGTSGIAVGRGAIVNGAFGIAQGDGTVSGATGQNVAIGSASTVANAGTAAGGAVAIGRGQKATGDGAVAIGDPNTATGTGAVAVGANDTANGQGAVALGNANTATGQGSVAIGNASNAKAAGGVAIGDTAIANNAKDVALGSGSVTAVAVATTGVTINGTAFTFAGTTPASTVSVGGVGSERTITNVAAGRISGTSTDAINGSQLFATNTAITAVGSIATNLGNTAATNLGGGVTYNAATGNLSAPSYAVGGVAQTSVGAAITALQAAAPVQYSTAGAPTTKNGLVPSQNVTLVGAAAGPVTLDNVAAGSTATGSTQAINGGQLNTGLASVATDLGGGSTYNPATGKVTPPSIVVGATTFTDVTSAIQAAGAGIKVTTAASGTGIANGTTVTTVAPGATATVTAGNNIITTQTGATIAVAVNPALTGLTSVAVTGGPTISSTGITNLASGTLSAASTDAVNGSQLYATNQNVTALTNGTAGLVQQATPTSTVTVAAATGGTTIDFTGTSGARTLQGVSAGSTATGSTQAVNGGQLNTGLASVATDLGGGSTYNPATGKVTAPSYAIGGTTYTDVGSALGALASGGASAKYFHANSSGIDSTATGANSIAIGQSAVANFANDVALGANSVTAAVSNTGPFDLTGGTAVATAPTSVVSVGTAGAERRITNVAAGNLTATSTDAVNSSQLFSVATDANKIGTTVASTLGDGATYTPGVGVTGFGSTVAGGTQTTVGAALTALDKAAQKQGTGLAAALGGTTAVAPDGTVTAPAFAVGSGTYSNVNAALAALQTGAPLQYTTAAGSTTPNGLVPSNSMTLVGTGAGNSTPVSLSNVAAGTLSATSSDAVNGSQLYATNQTVAALTNGTAGLVQQIGGAPGNGTLTVGATTGGTTVDFSNNTGANRVLQGVAAGSTIAGSTQAINGGQLNTALASVATNLGGGSTYNPVTGQVTAPNYTVQGTTVHDVGSALGAVDANLTTLNTAVNGGGVKYFHANSILADSSATGTNSVAIGPKAAATNANDVALGANSLTAGISSGATDITGGTAAGIAKAASGVVSVGSAGNERQIQNVAAGTLSATSTDAVNGSQLYSVATGANAIGSTVATTLGNGATYTPGTGITGFSSPVGGTTSTTVGAALTALDKATQKQGTGLANALGGGAAVAPDGTVTAPTFTIGSGTYSNVNAALNALQTGSPVQYTTAAGSTTPNGLVPSQSMTLVGKVAGAVGLSNVAAGTLSTTSTDAVNGSQLNTTNTQVAALNHSAIQYVMTPGGQTQSTINLATDQGGPVIIHNLAAGVAPTDAANYGQVQAVASVANNSVQYDKLPNGSQANSVTFGGPGATTPIALKNVAAGVAPTDAVNVAQLQGSAATSLTSAKAYTDQSLNNLSALSATGIKEAKAAATSGTALALAASGLRYDDRAGKLSMAGAMSLYHSTEGIAFGVGYTAKDQGMRLNLSVNGTPWAAKSEVGVVAGASFTLN